MSFDQFIMPFCLSVNKKGKGYQNQAMELIKICRDLSAVSEQSPHQDRKLQGVLRACDMAIKESALGSKVRGPTEQKIKDAVRELLQYGGQFHPNNGTIEPRMEVAKKKDKNSSKSKRINPRDKSLRVTRFHILRSLPDSHPRANPIIAEQALISSFELADILWNFSLVYDDNDDRRLSVAQNPHFYLRLPTLVNGTYQGESVAELVQPYPDTIYVLTNNERRVYLEFGEMRRTFDHIWRTNDALTFKDIIGRLESETTVEGSIPGPPFFWFRMNPPSFEPEGGGEIRNWRTPILALWDSPGTHIHIMKRTSTQAKAEGDRERETPSRRLRDDGIPLQRLQGVTNALESLNSLPPLTIDSDQDRRRTPLGTRSDMPSSTPTSSTRPSLRLSTQRITPASSHLPTPHNSPPTPIRPAEPDSSTPSRERRLRRSLNFVEPKLNTRTRNPDAPPPRR